MVVEESVSPDVETSTLRNNGEGWLINGSGRLTLRYKECRKEVTGLDIVTGFDIKVEISKRKRTLEQTDDDFVGRIYLW